ncbi:MAG: ABC transporter ATP-binding protein, partial [Alphaproteobacteria bacterium]
NGLNLAVQAGESVALVGPSGSGKSTLLQIAGLLDTPTSGSIHITGRELGKAGEGARTQARLQCIGFVYQFHHLLPEFSALENVMIPQMILGRNKMQAADKAHALLDRLGLADRVTHRPARLSGGEQQRVAIARALANDPVLLLADEPTGNLDEHTSERVFALLMEVVKENRLAALIATHNTQLAARMDRTVHLKDGMLI